MVKNVIRLTAVIEIEGRESQVVSCESQDQAIGIGREVGSELQLNLASVSRRHAVIVPIDGHYTIEDLGSTHGTRLNGKVLEPGQKKVLHSGDEIFLPQVKISCVIGSEKNKMASQGEGTQVFAARAVQDILGRMGETQYDGPYFRGLSGPDKDEHFYLSPKQAVWYFGRSIDCEFVLQDPNVSRHHARIDRDWNGFLLVDLGSKNGILVNDQLITKARRLQDGDVIGMGTLQLLFVDPDAELLSALKDVPGFHQDDPEEDDKVVEKVTDDNLSEDVSNSLSDGKQIEGIPEEDEGDIELSPHLKAANALSAVSESTTAAPQLYEDAETEALADIDQALLDEKPRQVTSEWLILLLSGVLLVFSGVSLWLLWRQ